MLFGADFQPEMRVDSSGKRRFLKKMAAKLDEIRNAAERVASTLELDVVDVEFAAAGRSRFCA